MDTVNKPTANDNAITVEGVRISFPYRPYGPQIQIMKTVIKAAKAKQNALVDSPTGTGKTLALLCPLIAWQSQENSRSRSEQEQQYRGTQFLDDVPNAETCKRDQPVKSASPTNGNVSNGQVTYGPAKSSTAIKIEKSSINESNSQELYSKKLAQFDGREDDDIELLESEPSNQAGEPAQNSSRQPEKLANQQTVDQSAKEQTTAVTGDNGNELDREARRKRRFEERSASDAKMEKAFGVTRERLAAMAKRSAPHSKSGSDRSKRAIDQPKASQYDFEKASTTALPLKLNDINHSNPKSATSWSPHVDESASVVDSDSYAKPKTDSGNADININVPTNGNAGNAASKGSRSRYIRIVYATRTHKQIKHVIHELKKTAYRSVNMSILGSREHYCVHPLVMRSGDKATACLDLQKGRGLVNSLSNVRQSSKTSDSSSLHSGKATSSESTSEASSSGLSARDEAHLASARQCPFHTQTRSFNDSRSLKRVHINSAWDIEEIVDALRKQRACPYYVSKQLALNADVVFCPYNYLLDPAIRDAMQVDDLIHNAVVVFDEAHNIEQSARDGASCEADSIWMSDCLVHIESCFMASKRQKNELSNDNEHHYVALQNFVRQLAVVTNSLGDNLSFDQSVREDYAVKSGRDVLAMLRELGVDSADKIKQLDDHVAAVADNEKDNGDDEKRYASDGEVHLATLHVHRLRSIFRVASCVLEHLEDYRVAVVKTRSMQTEGTRRQWARPNTVHLSQTAATGWLSTQVNNSPFQSSQRGGRMSDGIQIVTTIKFWCLSPAIAFSAFAKHVRCVVLASGTLSPTVSFASELGAVFPHSLETAHVVPATNTLCAALTKGPNGTVLKFVHRTNEDLKLQDELGATIAKLCEAVPFGVLCFFASYSVLDRLTSRWRGNPAWQSIQSTKYIFVESRFERKLASVSHKPKAAAANKSRQYPAMADLDGNEDNDAAAGLDGFYQRIAELEADYGHNDTCDKNAFEWNAARIRAKLPTGAILFAVCRGRVSEGLDFTDNQARAVITVGIPYPNFTTPEVKLKMEYNDVRRRAPPANSGLATASLSSDISQQSSTASSVNLNAWLSGNEWYTIEAFRALNQALGRCIRHRNDWGIILLVDERFAASEVHTKSKLSCWLRQRVNSFGSFDELKNSINEFLRTKSVAPTRVNAASLAPKDDLDINFDQRFQPQVNTNTTPAPVKRESDKIEVSRSTKAVYKKYLPSARHDTVKPTFSQILKDIDRSKSKLNALAQSTQIAASQQVVESDAGIIETTQRIDDVIATSSAMATFEVQPLSPIGPPEEAVGTDALSQSSVVILD